MKSNRLKYGAVSVMSVGLLALTGCGGVSGGGSDLSAEERLDEFWTEAQNALDIEQFQELTEQQDREDFFDTLDDHEEIPDITEEYVDTENSSVGEGIEWFEEDLSEEEVSQFVTMAPYMMDHMAAGMEAIYDEDFDFEEDEYETEDLADGVRILDVEEDGDTMTIDFIPESFFQYYLETDENYPDDEEELEDEVADDVMSYSLVMREVDDKWMVDLESAVDMINEI